MSEPQDQSAPASGPSRRRLIILLAVLGLIVAAFAMPGVGSGAAGSGSGGGDGGGGGGFPDIDFNFDLTDLLDGDGDGDRERESDREPGEGERDVEVDEEPEGDIRVGTDGGGDGGGETIYVGDGEGRERGELYEGCLVYLESEPSPGQNVTVFVWNDRAPVEDVPVHFNGERQGRTDENGQVVGTVGYEKELSVQVSVPSADSCVFASPEGRISGRNTGSVSDQRAGAGQSASNAVTSGGRYERLADGDRRPELPEHYADEDHTVTVDVDGELGIHILEEPYPGETVTVDASVDGRPLPDATVRLDGNEVGQTDDAGRLAVTLPENTEQVTLAVKRGDFSTTETVELTVLDVAVRPVRPLPVPGQRAVVNVTLGGEPVSNTTVSLGGEQVGRTDEDGRLLVTLPPDAGAGYTASVRAQEDTLPVWRVYLPTLLSTLFLVLLGVGGVVFARRTEDRPPVRDVVVAWSGLSLVFLAYVFGGSRAALIVGGGLLLVAVGYALAVHRETTASAAGGFWDWLRGLPERLRRGVVLLADKLGALAIAVVERLRGISLSPDAIRGYLTSLAAWMRETLGQAMSALQQGVSRLSEPTVLVGVFATLVTAMGAYLLVGPVGAIGVILVAAVIAYLVSRRSTADERASETESTRGHHSPASSDEGGHDVNPVTLRRLWRTFARWVVPGRWRSRTPGEISRRAIDAGFPREPVEQLTEVFRDVEYGNRSLSDARWDAAKAAFDALAGTGSEEEEK